VPVQIVAVFILKDIHMSGIPRWLIGMGSICVLLNLVAGAAMASENATFECASGPSQVCNFSIIRQPGGAQKFAVQGRQRTVIPGLAPGQDWYLVAVGHPAPANLDACRRAAFQCKAAIVQHGVNR
jgi:hypothetical protein